jgi:1,4-dihydroxy-2-naphthoyl-CoA hydrolase
MARVENLTMATKKAVKKSTAFIPHDPHRVMQNGVARTLGMRVVSITKKKVVAEMPIDERHMNRNGRVNGGALMAFADAMGAIGTVANLPPGHMTTTLESKTNFFAAGAAPTITGVAKPLHIGRSTNVWQTTLKNADGRLVAIVTQTQMVLAPRGKS